MLSVAYSIFWNISKYLNCAEQNSNSQPALRKQVNIENVKKTGLIKNIFDN